jgi:hypothetical protein
MWSLALLVLLAVVFAIALGLVAIVLLMIGRRYSASEPSCGQCGYAVEGLETLKCPECGADLRKVGIVTPQAGRGWRPFVLVVILGLAWTLLVPAIGLPVSIFAGQRLPRSWSRTMATDLEPRSSDILGAVGLRFTAIGAYQNIPYDTLELTASPPAGAPGPRLLVNLAEATASMETAAAPTPTPAPTVLPFDAATVEQWLAEQVPGLAPADAASAAAEVIGHSANLEQGSGLMMTGDSYFSSGSTSVTTIRLPIRWFAPTVIAAWTMVWLLGLWPLVRWLRKQRAITTPGE